MEQRDPRETRLLAAVVFVGLTVDFVLMLVIGGNAAQRFVVTATGVAAAVSLGWFCWTGPTKHQDEMGAQH